MNLGALFDKLLVDLSDLGVAEGRDDTGARLLVRDGVPFARLGNDERMAFRAVSGTEGSAEGRAGEARREESAEAVRDQASDLALSQDAGDWVVVPADDVAHWESLARKALGTTPG